MSDDVMRLVDKLLVVHVAALDAYGMRWQDQADANEAAARAALVAALQQAERRFAAAPDADLLLLRDVLLNDLGSADSDKVREWIRQARSHLAACQQALGEARDAIKRNTLIDDDDRLAGTWVAIPEQAFKRLRDALSASRPAGGAPDDAKGETP